MFLKPVSYEWQWKLKSSSTELWPLVADISRIHKVLGLLASKTTKKATAFLYQAAPNTEQSSINWIRDNCIHSLLTYKSGPILQVASEITLKNHKHGTVLTHKINLTPSNLLGTIVIPFLLGRNIHKDLDQLYLEIDNALSNKQENIFTSKVSKVPQARQKQLKKIAEELIQEGFSKEAIQLLIRSLAHDTDSNLTQMRPRILASVWGVTPKKLTDLFIASAQKNLLQMFWQVSCSHCNRGKVIKNSLKDISPKMPCPSCKQEIAIDLSRNVELAFKPHPSVRPLKSSSSSLQCPIQKPQIVIQYDLQPGQQITEPLCLPTGHYSVYSNSNEPEHVQSLYLANSQQGEIFINIEETAITLIHKPEGPENIVKLANSSNNNQRVHFEEVSWQQRRITGTMANTSEYLRSNITNGTIAPNEPLHVSNIFILVTRIIGSSYYFQQEEDLKIYHLQEKVRSFLKKILDRYDGAIFDYRGKNILSSFTNPKAAMKAALALWQEFQSFNATLSESEQMTIKIGLHGGSCIAYNDHNLTNYFGHTLSIAQMIAKQCSDQSIALSKDFYNKDNVQTTLKPFESDLEIQEKQNTKPLIEGMIEIQNKPIQEHAKSSSYTS